MTNGMPIIRWYILGLIIFSVGMLCGTPFWAVLLSGMAVGGVDGYVCSLEDGDDPA